MKAILLCAGQGKRLLPLTANTPKCALTVLDRAVLHWQIHQIQACGIREIVVMNGFGETTVNALVANLHYDGLVIRTVYNPFYAQSDNLATCWMARHEMVGDFVLINGDTLFESAILARLLAERGKAPITLVADAKANYDDDDMLIVADGDQLRRVGKRMKVDGINGESIGMLAFDATGAQVFRGKLDQLIRDESGMNRWYLSAVDELAQQGTVGICRINGLSWCEIDTRFDLANAVNVVSRWPEQCAEPALREGSVA